MTRNGHMPLGGFQRALVFAFVLLGAGCSGSYPTLDSSSTPSETTTTPAPEYLIGPGDTLQITVRDNPDLSTSVSVRPDGRISMAFVRDLDVASKTPAQVADAIENVLSRQPGAPLKTAVVTVVVTGFKGPYTQQIRVVGEAAKPQALQYRQGMTVLDAMIEVGGLTQYAAGNSTVLVRTVNGKEIKYYVRVGDLIRGGDISANVGLLPGDILIIPQSWF